MGFNNLNVSFPWTQSDHDECLPAPKDVTLGLPLGGLVVLKNYFLLGNWSTGGGGLFINLHNSPSPSNIYSMHICEYLTG